jgi:mRNA-degrading endonuclease RelE of RelBE toxin-antitoxin system
MSAALQVYHQPFDLRFFKLPAQIQAQVEAKIDQMGLRLASLPHYHLTGSNRFRLRVGVNRGIYTFDISRNVIDLLAVGHCREIYRELE